MSARLADAAVYEIALFGVHRARTTQVKAARVSGVLQLLLALGALAEVVRRVLFGSEPEAPLMIAVAIVALGANATSMWLLSRHRGGGAHMKASWIFTTNDVIANLGVIAAAVLVRLLNSPLPDLVVATIIALVVLNGAVKPAEERVGHGRGRQRSRRSSTRFARRRRCPSFEEESAGARRAAFAWLA